MRVKDYDCYIVVKNGYYLVSKPYPDTLFVRWSNSPYEGCRIERLKLAKMIANVVGGRVVTFNPVSGDLAN